MEDRVKVEMKDGVADVRLVRADKMNALDDAMFGALIETGERLKADTQIRAIVLSGEGRAFCAGLDMGRFQTMAAGGRRGARSFQGVRESDRAGFGFHAGHRRGAGALQELQET